MNQNEQMREAIVAMVEDGWLHSGAEGMSDAQQKVYDAYREITAINCEYCGGNDETPQDHCVDCERPQALASEPAPNHIPDATKMVEPSEDAKRTLANPPERIYLQVGDVDSEFPGEIHWRDVTWSDEQVERSDLVYVRQPAPLVRLTEEEISKIEHRVWANTIDKGGLMALFILRFAKAIMDAMIAKNGGKV